MRVVAIGVVVLASALAAGVDTAHACSCVQPDPRTMLPQADGAFVGTLVSRRDTGGGRSLFTFSVERSVKGAIGDTIEVESASNGAACGIETPVGARIGLFVQRRGGAWSSTLCSQVDADDLLAAARPLPKPDGEGPVAMVVGGRFGSARLLALDARGRTLAYGKGAGSTTAIAACPGGKRVVDVAALLDGWQLAVRDRRTLRRVRTRPLALPAATVVKAIRCDDPSGARVLVFASSADYPGRARLLRVGTRGVATVWRGTAPEAALSRVHAYIATGKRGTGLVRLELATGRTRLLGHIPPSISSLRLSPGGTHLAGIASGSPDGGSTPARAVLVDLRVRPVRTRTSPLVAGNASGDVVWLSTERLVVLEYGQTNEIRIFDRALRARGRMTGWAGRGAALVGSSLFGIRWDGRLVQAALPNGPVRVVRRLPSLSAYAIVALR